MTDLVKVRIESQLAHGVVTETPWAEPLGGDLYRLDNSPWFFAGANYRDVVRCERDDPDNFPLLVGMADAGGHTTARLLFDPRTAADSQKRLLARLTEAGASYEGTGGERQGVYAVDVPPDANAEWIRTTLDRAAQRGLLEWQFGGTADFLSKVDRAVASQNFTSRHSAPLVDEPSAERALIALEASGRYAWEQIWGRRSGPGRLIVLNAPFYAYDLAVGDEVEIKAESERIPTVGDVIERSGRWVLRVLLPETADSEPRGLDAVMRLAEKTGARTERPTNRSALVAVDAPDDNAARALFEQLQTMEAEGKLSFETGWG